MHRLFEWLTASQQYFQDLGWIGVFAFAAVIMVAQVFMIPLSPLALASGVFFGFWGGLTAITLGTGAGAAFNFIVARHLAREAVERRLAHHEKFQLIDAAIAREGWKIVALLRFCPMPFGLANYCYGLTAIRFWPYLLTTVLCIIPANVILSGIGASAKEGLASLLGSGRPRHPSEYVLLGVGILAAFAALTYIGKIANTALARGNASAQPKT